LNQALNDGWQFILPMIIHRLKSPLLSLAIVAGLGSGCMSPKPDPTRHFTLSATAKKAASTTDLKLLVREVEIPEYLNRSSLVIRKSATEVVVSEYDRWAEPLESGITRVLATNLSALLGSPTVYGSPQFEANADYRVLVTIRAFEPTGDRILLSASWRVLNREDRELAAGIGDYPRAISAGSTEQSISGMSSALAELAAEIAAGVVKRAQTF
jgi:uncharacterized lipoprotein YmbA